MNPDRAFFEAFDRCFAPHAAVRTPGTPAEMVVRDGPDSAGWVEWKFIPTGRDFAAEFAGIEQTIGRRLPGSFKRWYGSHFTLDVDVSVVRLPANPSNAPLDPLRKALAPSASNKRAIGLGLLPFGDEANMDAGPLCFDARGGGDPDAWQVTYWDHEWAGTDNEIGPPIFSNFERLIACCTAYMNAFVDVRRAQPDDPDRWLDSRPACLRAMVKEDPAGAGGPGLSYWQSWMQEDEE